MRMKTKYKSILLLAIIVTSLGAVVGTSMYVPDPSNDDEVPIASLFPWNQTIYFYTKLLGQGGFMNIKYYGYNAYHPTK